MSVSLTLQFSGGSEVLFNGKREHKVEIQHEKPTLTVAELLDWVLRTLLKDCNRPELLIIDGDVRPGILLLINDTDWEIFGGSKSTVKSGDVVTFISTLHGG